MISLVALTPLLLAALGGLLTELSGNLNIALEGLLAIGAFFAITIHLITGSTMLAILFSSLITASFAWLLQYSSQKLKSNFFVSALAFNLIILGLIPLLSQLVFQSKGILRLSPETEVFNFIPYLTVLIAIVTIFSLYYTRWGLTLRIADKKADALQVPKRLKLQREAMFFSGILAGLGGASVALELNSYVPNMTAGKGWLALVLVYAGYKNPVGIVVATLFILYLQNLAYEFQGYFNIPDTLLLMLPYILSIFLLIVVQGLRKLINRFNFF